MIQRIENDRKNPNWNDKLMSAEVLVFQGRFVEAANLYVKC